MELPLSEAALGDTGTPHRFQEHEEAELADLGLGLAEHELKDEGAEGDVDGSHEASGDEAEEEPAPVATAAMRRLQREHEQHMAVVEQVKALTIKMEKAIEDDERDVSEGRPGPQKLAMISEIEETAKNVRAHKVLIQSGFVGLLKGFLEPLVTDKTGRNGHLQRSMPHLKVRVMVYKLLGALPISTQNQEGKETLKRSEIGPVLRFYAQVKDETERNRRAVNELLTRWMSPIVDEGRKATKDAAVERLTREAEIRDSKKRRLLDMEKEENEKNRLKKNQDAEVGDPGFQYHARRPRQARPDYVRAPQSAFMDLQNDGGKQKKKRGLIAQLNSATRKLIQHNKRGADRSTKVEVAIKDVGIEILEPMKSIPVEVKH